MTTRSSIIILLFLAAAFALDFVFSAGIAVFAGQKFLALIELIAIWR